MKDFPFRHGARYLLPNKIALYASFHPSPRNVNTGKLNQKMLTELFLDVKRKFQLEVSNYYNFYIKFCFFKISIF